MGARVLYRDSQGRDGSVVLDPSQPAYVGRALDCAIRTDDAMVSRKHSMIRMENGRFYVEDLGSSNGTHVNDVRVTKHFLSHNDVVRCGSLWLRYVEDGPMPLAGPGMMVGVPPQVGPKKGGTRRLEPADAPVPVGPAALAAQALGPRGASIGHAATLAPNNYSPVYSPSRQPAAPAPPAAPFGGPPPMPAHGELIGRTPSQLEREKEDSVVVDLGVDPLEHDRLRTELERMSQMLEDAQTAYDREVADGKRLRAEAQTLRDRMEELRRSVGERQEAVDAQERVADELRDEARQAREGAATARAQLAEMSDTLAARDRQLARAHDDIGKLKGTIEDLERQVADVSRTKDEGWRKLNEQLKEIDNLREVVNEQERMLEERRVGLIGQEEVISQLRGDKERMLKEKAQLAAERDELRIDAGRAAAQIAAIDEENKRLTRLFAEAQSRASSGKAASPEHTAEIAEQLKSLRVELRTVESDRDRLLEMYERSDAEVERLQQVAARLEVESREWHDKSDRALSNKVVAEDALTKAELARSKAEEEALTAIRQRDEAVLAADQTRRDLDRLRRGGDEAGKAQRDRLEEAQVRISELEEALAALRRQARPAGDDGDTTAVVAAPLGAPALLDRARDVHDAINDVLSDMRGNILLIQGEFEQLAEENSSASARIIEETIRSVVKNAEEAKAALRRLRELVES